MKKFSDIEPGDKFLYVKDNGDFLQTIFMKIHPYKVEGGEDSKEVNTVSDKGILYHLHEEDNVAPIKG